MIYFLIRQFCVLSGNKSAERVRRKFNLCADFARADADCVKQLGAFVNEGGVELFHADGREGLNSLMLANAMLLSTWEHATIGLPFDDARYADRLAALAAKSPKKTAKPIHMDLSKSF